MQKIGRAIILSVLFSILVLGCAKRNQEMVIVVEKTRTYHIEQCPRIVMANAEEMTRGEARKRKYHPCPDCLPQE